MVEVNSFDTSNGGEDCGDDKMHKLFGPGQVDQMIRQAIQFCWMALPNDRRNLDEVASQIRRIVDRALRDLKEDGEAFAQGDEP